MSEVVLDIGGGILSIKCPDGRRRLFVAPQFGEVWTDDCTTYLVLVRGKSWTEAVELSPTPGRVSFPDIHLPRMRIVR